VYYSARGRYRRRDWSTVRTLPLILGTRRGFNGRAIDLSEYRFRITPSDDVDHPITAGTATGAWSVIVKAANRVRSRYVHPRV
jgi:hypothetical protein